MKLFIHNVQDPLRVCPKFVDRIHRDVRTGDVADRTDGSAQIGNISQHPQTLLGIHGVADTQSALANWMIAVFGFVDFSSHKDSIAHV